MSEIVFLSRRASIYRVMFSLLYAWPSVLLGSKPLEESVRHCVSGVFSISYVTCGSSTRSTNANFHPRRINFHSLDGDFFELLFVVMHKVKSTPYYCNAPQSMVYPILLCITALYYMQSTVPYSAVLCSAVPTLLCCAVMCCADCAALCCACCPALSCPLLPISQLSTAPLDPIVLNCTTYDEIFHAKKQQL